jgi:hypothetical protein
MERQVGIVRVEATAEQGLDLELPIFAFGLLELLGQFLFDALALGLVRLRLGEFDEDRCLLNVVGQGIVRLDDGLDGVGAFDLLPRLQRVVPEIRAGRLGLKLFELTPFCREVKDTPLAR